MHCSKLLLAVTLICSAAYAESITPPAFIKPYPGARIYGEPTVKEFDEVELFLGKIKDSRQGIGRIEGKITQLTYDIPDGRSTLEVYKNYEQALFAAGFKKVFACSGKDCGDSISPVKTWSGAVKQFTSSEARYLTAKLERTEGYVWVGLYVTPIGMPLTKIIIAEEKPMDTGMVTVDAAALKGALERDGHIAVYGIVFDTGKATLKSESAKVLVEIKKVLEQDPKLRLYVVGHTDDVGDASANVLLSEQRAGAVVNELSTTYKIAPNRLKPQGVGPYVPVATNRNEAGRAKNRRVEVVETQH